MEPSEPPRVPGRPRPVSPAWPGRALPATCMDGRAPCSMPSAALCGTLTATRRSLVSLLGCRWADPLAPTLSREVTAVADGRVSGGRGRGDGVARVATRCLCLRRRGPQASAPEALTPRLCSPVAWAWGSQAWRDPSPGAV